VKPVATLLTVLVLVSGSVGCHGSRDDKATGVPKAEIAAALTSFTEAFVNGDTSALPELVSKGCNAQQVAQLQNASQLGNQVLLGGKLNLTVDANSLVLKVQDHGVAVPLDQPAGALVATFTINGQPGPYEHPLDLFHAPPVFVGDRGAWRLSNCGALLKSRGESASTP